MLTNREAVILFLSNMLVDVQRGRKKAGEAINFAADHIEGIYGGFMCLGSDENGRCPHQCGDCKYQENAT